MSKKKKTFQIRLCPFCGHVPWLGRTVPWWVSCDNCGADGPSKKTAQAAVNAWNNAQVYAEKATVEPDN